VVGYRLQDKVPRNAVENDFRSRSNTPGDRHFSARRALIGKWARLAASSSGGHCPRPRSKRSRIACGSS
jgi:hypothetical protein